MSEDSGRTARGQALYDAYQEKVRATFEGKKFTILEEVHLDKDQRFETAFGNKGRNGYILVEVGNPGNKVIVGATVLRRVASDYASVELPPEAQKRKRRTKAQKAADDAAKAQLREERLAQQARLIDDIVAKSQAERDSAPVSDDGGDNGDVSAAEENEVVSALFR